jgi:hypothetical protein
VQRHGADRCDAGSRIARGARLAGTAGVRRGTVMRDDDDRASSWSLSSSHDHFRSRLHSRHRDRIVARIASRLTRAFTTSCADDRKRQASGHDTSGETIAHLAREIFRIR